MLVSCISLATSKLHFSELTSYSSDGESTRLFIQFHGSNSRSCSLQGAHDSPGHHGEGKKDKKEDKSNDKMLAAGTAGLLVGGIGGAVIAHEMSMLP